MEDLLKGGVLITELNEQIVFNQLDGSAGAVWSLLLASGYLKVEKLEQSTKNAQGVILRTEGKQSESSDDDRVIFQPMKEQAVYLEQRFRSVAHIPETDD